MTQRDTLLLCTKESKASVSLLLKLAAVLCCCSLGARMVSLGVIKNQKANKKPPRQKKKKRLVRKAVDYLKSDSYLFAPLISPSNPVFIVPKINLALSSSSDVGTRSIGGRNKRFLEIFRDYLISDSYMYSPSLPSTKGPKRHIKRVGIEVSKRRLNGERTEKQPDGNCTPEREISGRNNVVRAETLKRKIYQHFRF